MMQIFFQIFSHCTGFYIPRAKILPIKAVIETVLAEVCCFGSFLFSLGYILLSVALTHCKDLVSMTDYKLLSLIGAAIIQP